MFIARLIHYYFISIVGFLYKVETVCVACVGRDGASVVNLLCFLRACHVGLANYRSYAKHDDALRRMSVCGGECLTRFILNFARPE